MGKQVSTLKMTGSFAGAVGYIDQQGRVQMRSKAEKFTDANTKKQQAVRTRFLAITSLAKAFSKTALGLSIVAKQKKLTWRNMFTKVNYGATEATIGNDSVTADTDFTLLEVSRGDNPEVSWGSPNFDDPLTVKATFSKNTDLPGADDKDLVYLLVYNPADNRTIISDPVTRDVNGSTVSVTVPNSWNGETVHVWGFSQGFKSEQARTEYLSYWNRQRAAGAAEALTQMSASDTEFSNSHYIGNGSIS